MNPCLFIALKRADDRPSNFGRDTDTHSWRDRIEPRNQRWKLSPDRDIDWSNFVRYDGYYASGARASRLTHYEHRHDQVPSKASVLWLDPNSTIRHAVALYVSGTNEISMYGG